MVTPVLADQQGLTYISSVWSLDAVYKTLRQQGGKARVDFPLAKRGTLFDRAVWDLV